MEVLLDVKRCFSYLPWKARTYGAALACLMLASALAEIVSIASVIPFVTALINPGWVSEEMARLGFSFVFEPDQLPMALFGLFSCAILISILVRYLSMRFQIAYAQYVGHQLSRILFRRIIQVDYHQFKVLNVADLVSSLTLKLDQVIGNLFLPLLVLVQAVTFLTFAFVFLILAYPSIGMLLVTALVFFYLAVWKLLKTRIFSLSRKINADTSKLFVGIQQSLADIRHVIIGRQVTARSESHNEIDLSLRRGRSKLLLIAGTPKFIIEGVTIIGSATVAFTMFLSGSVEVYLPVLAAFALGAQKSLPLAQQAYASIASINGSSAQLSSVLSLFDVPQRGTCELSGILNIKADWEFKSLTLCGVSFRYDYRESSTVLKNVNLHLNKGDWLGIIGPSGAGKSTLLDILLCLVRATHGSVTLNEETIDDELVEVWHSACGFASQESFLFDGTIAENIDPLSRQSIDYDSCLRLLDCVELKSVVDQYSMFQEKIGERGQLLSGGQRQRLAIARALYKNPQILVLDEATSALDPALESRVMKGIRRIFPNITLVIVTHRYHTLRHCNKVIEVSDGFTKVLGENDVELLLREY